MKVVKYRSDRCDADVHLRWLDTVFKKLSYSLLDTFNFCAVKENFFNKTFIAYFCFEILKSRSILKVLLYCSCILSYFLSNYGSFDNQCSVAIATLAYEIYSETRYFATKRMTVTPIF